MYTWLWILAVVVLLAVAVFWARRAGIRFPGFSHAVSGKAAREKTGARSRVPDRTSPHTSEPRVRPGEKTLRTVLKPIRTLPKEVELAWEASEIIDIQPGAYARTGKEPHPWQIPQESPAVLPPERRLDKQERYELPSRYGTDRLILMARDPNWLYAYWEVTHQTYAEMRERHLREWHLSRPVLRLSDVTPGVPQEQKHLDVYITEEADNWYVHVGRPRHTLFAEIGRLFPHSVFVPFMRSNSVTLPPDSVSGEISEEWAPLEWPHRYAAYRRDIGLSSPWLWGRKR